MAWAIKARFDSSLWSWYFNRSGAICRANFGYL